MTSTFTTDTRRAPIENATSARAEVRLDASSWAMVVLAPYGVRRSFDPQAAGRRAVRKHGEALRRLSD